MTTDASVDPCETRTPIVDWNDVLQRLDDRGFATVSRLLSAEQCQRVCAEFDNDDLYRSHIVMQRHGYGQGEYKYFAYPLPALVQQLRERLFRELSPLANQWAERLKLEAVYPQRLAEFLAQCHHHEQKRPTPLVLRYGAGDYNRLHQDLYGDICFPIQVAILLDRPGEDFDGGEFVLTEQKPRSQSRPHVVSLNQGDAVIFAVNERPAKGARGYYRLKMRHGVSELHAGHRRTLGIIFHDAE